MFSGRGMLAVAGGAVDRCRCPPGAGSGERGKRADACERVVEVLLPGPAGGHPECPLPGGACQPAGDSKQPVAAGGGGGAAVVGGGQLGGPPPPGLRGGGGHRPRAVGGGPRPGGEWQSSVFYV